MRIHKGDRVQVLQGKDKGKTGEVMFALPKEQKVIVEGINIAKRHQRATNATMQGGIIDKDMPIHVNSVAIVCSKCGPTRIGYRFDSEGVKHRICKKCGGDL